MIADNIWSEARRTFLELPGVVGVGWGAKLRSGKVVDYQSIIVFVDAKLPIAELPPEQVIPSSFRGVPTDVRVPLITRETDPEAPPGTDMCLTDNMWIDWGKVHRRQVAGTREG